MQDQASGPPVPYMERTRNYYRALGYTKDYVWAHHADVPFTRPGKPVSDMRIALICTAQETGTPAIRAASPPTTFDTDVAWDRKSTHTEDRETFLPIDAAQRLVAGGTLGGLAPRFHTAPTEYSQAKTTERDAPEILRRLWHDAVDAAILTAL